MRLFSWFNHITEFMLSDLWQVTCSPFYIIYSNQREAFQHLFCKRHCPHYRENRLTLRNRTSNTAWSKIWKEKKPFTALHDRTSVTTRHPSNIELTPKSQRDILTVIHCCSLCQESAHQQLADAGIGHTSFCWNTTSLQALPSFQPVRRISSTAPEHIASVLPVWWNSNSSFVSSQSARCSPRESSFLTHQAFIYENVN